MNRIFTFVGFTFLVLYFSMSSCKHDSLIDDMEPMPPDTMMVDTTNPCDDNKVYFFKDVLPILRANCALSGCHDAATATEDVVLESYESLIESDVVEPFDLDDSELFERITDSDPDKRMPRPPANRLTFDQINTISNWILQGADNEMCQDSVGQCQTDNVSYSGDIQPVLELNCYSCHSSPTPNGGVFLDSHDGVQTVALNGRLIGAIDRLPGFEPMPQGQDKLDVCTIDKFKSWVDAGAPNN